ncbi:recombinase family protein [Pedobacter sp. UBA5917]|jgi:DNA invertase Pin-like site-specific DNA recombinase|uniref:recombinase family protein n=1 Tax=Pedobacter sp. UBA5917 TaxID=1947061 RepID=UPI0025EF9B80|nr:recombinase family protein [Pedobacter sp. UBA5917]
MKIGYARVSTSDQNYDLQLEALEKYGCTHIYKEKISGKSLDRPELSKLLHHLRKGDEVIVWKLDRLGRSIKDLIEIVSLFEKNGVNFVSLNDNIDTTTAVGRFTFNLFAALSQFEREIIRERTKAGLSAAKARGRHGGRPKGLTPEKKEIALTACDLHNTGKYSVAEISKRLKLPIATCYRYIRYIRDANTV